MDINDIRSLVTLLLFIGFLLVVWWAYGRSRKTHFRQLGDSIFDPEEEQVHRQSVREADQ